MVPTHTVTYMASPEPHKILPHTVICLNEEKIIITWVHPDSHRKWLELEILKGNWHDRRKMPPDAQDPQVPGRMLSEVLSFSM